MFSHCAPKTLRPRRIDAASSLRRQTKAGHPAQARFGLLHRRIAGAGTLCRQTADLSAVKACSPLMLGNWR